MTIQHDQEPARSEHHLSVSEKLALTSVLGIMAIAGCVGLVTSDLDVVPDGFSVVPSGDHMPGTR